MDPDRERPPVPADAAAEPHGDARPGPDPAPDPASDRRGADAGPDADPDLDAIAADLAAVETALGQLEDHTYPHAGSGTGEEPRPS